MRIISKLTALAVIAGALLCTACTTQVAVNSKADPVATFRNGVFYGKVAGEYAAVFRATNRSLDELGYTRVGEIPEQTAMTIVARGMGDVRVQVQLTRSASEPGVINVRIAVGRGDLPACQKIFNKISTFL